MYFCPVRLSSCSSIIVPTASQYTSAEYGRDSKLNENTWYFTKAQYFNVTERSVQPSALAGPGGHPATINLFPQLLINI